MNKRIFFIVISIISLCLIIALIFQKQLQINSVVVEPANIPTAVEVLRNMIAFQNLSDVTNIKVVSYKEVTWSDSCMGLNGKDEVCATILIPGYEVVLKIGQTQHTYHINSDAGMVREVKQ